MNTTAVDCPELGLPNPPSETPAETETGSDPTREHPEDGDEEEEDKRADPEPEPEPAGSEPRDPQWVEERFRIDRKKLESMLHSPEDGNGLTGEEFFQKVMMETDTQIKWPSKLKIGAKSKKDPHVKVEGRRVNVQEAKRKILDLLETKVNKVTLKMDVTHTEHSHVIGKGGGNIKKVMEVTECHIHFPDSNRHNVTGEKSNQVSIAGPVLGVESARRRIRDLQPLVLTFDLPGALVPQAPLDASAPVIQQVAQAFGVSVSFRQQPKFYICTCQVRGLQGNCASVKKATCVLVELLVGVEASVTISTQLELTSQQQLLLLGQNGASFLNIMHLTQTQILLPDLNAPHGSASLTIQGGVDGVCLARQQILDCLPVCLMFDMREGGEVDPRKLSQMMQNLCVFISVKPKMKQTAKSVVVKSLERNITNLYKARHMLLGLDTSEVTVAIKTTCDALPAANGLTAYWLNLLMQQLRLSDAGAVTTPETVMGAILQVKPRPSPPPGLSGHQEEARTPLRGADSKLEQIPENEDQMSSTNTPTTTQTPPAKATRERGNSESSSRRNSQSEASRDQNQEGSAVPSQQSTVCQNSSQLLFNRVNMVRRNSLKPEIIQTLELSSDSARSEDYDYERKKLMATRAMQKKPVVTEVRRPTDTWSGLGFSKSMPAEAIKDLRCVSRRSYKSYLGNSHLQTWSSTNSKARASNGSDSENWRERRGSSPSESLVSSSSSSSSSSPSSSSLTGFVSSCTRGRADRSSETFLSSSDYFDGLSTATRTGSSNLTGPAPQHTDDLPELFGQLGLEKYTDIFQQQEIDFQTFLTLSDEDLKEVGVSTFGARRKMLLAIADLNKSKRKLLDPPTVRPGYLEGGASGRLPRIIDVDAAQSSRW
ncbi:bicaudal C homolog 2 [Megalops cyprinoides]|uniref:bicaudal C homolog 2 n=1 Tax=Megalops cyprinoides TaxID=118141 RepID=UPI001863A58B|nr:bicaudal C homolog 2 [Megalops cyprinoides]